VEAKAAASEETVAEIKEEMATLKVQLYGRFGKSINLDE